MSRYRGKKESVISLLIALLLIIICVATISDFQMSAYVALLVISAWILYVFGGANILSPITLFYLMYLFFIALGPLMFYNLKISLDVQIYYLVIISLYVLILGYYLGKLKKTKIKQKRIWKLSENNIGTVILICNCIIILSILLKIYYLISNRSILFSGTFNSGRLEASSGNGLISFGGNLWSPAACILIEVCLKGVKLKKSNWALIGCAMILGLFSGFRTGVAAFALTVVLMINKKRKIPTIRVICLGCCALLFLYLYELMREGSFSNTIFDINTIFDMITENAYVGIINIRYILNAFPTSHPFLYGYGYLINIIMLKPGPDLDFTLTLKEMLGLSFGGGGVTPTLIGEFYLNFGMFGVFLGMFFSGILLEKIEKMYNDSNMYYIPAFFMVEFVIAVRSGFANIEITMLINCVLYLFICFVSRKYKIHIK